MANNSIPDCIEHTHSLAEFIDMGKSIKRYDYVQFAMIDNIDGAHYVIHNIMDDYIDELKERSLWVKLTDAQVREYMYNPKKLSFKLYDTTLFHYLILKLNDMCSTHDFTLDNNKVLLLRKDFLKEVISEIYSNEKTAILSYNNAHDNLSSLNVVSNDRLQGTV